MSSIALQFKETMLAKKAVEQQNTLAESYEAESIRQTAEDYDQFQLLVNALETDMKELSGLAPGDKNRIREKKLIPKYLPIAQNYLESDTSYRNPVLVLAFPALEQKQPMPQRFQKVNLPTFVCDNVLSWANAQLARGNSIEPQFSQVFETMLEDNWKVPREVVAKFHKISGEVHLKNGSFENALEDFVRATEIDPAGAKCTTKINQLKKRLNR